MTSKEIIDWLESFASRQPDTWDSVKHGDPDKEIKRVAVGMFPTAELLSSVKDGAYDLLIVHEPLFFEGDGEPQQPCEVVRRKKELLSGLDTVVYRYHDHMHDADVDMIAEGELHYLGITGQIKKSKYYASSLFHTDKPVSALELARAFEEKLGLRHVRIAGQRNMSANNLALCFGMSGGVNELIRDSSVEIVIVGEAESLDWRMAEYARDAAALGFNKSIIALGHCGSERAGMRYLSERIRSAFPSVTVDYFECPDPYSYTED